MLFSQYNYQEQAHPKCLNIKSCEAYYLGDVGPPNTSNISQKPENVATALILVLASEVERRLIIKKNNL